MPPTPKKTITTRDVVAIAKKVVLNNEETKRYGLLWGNVMQHALTGAWSFQYKQLLSDLAVGNEIYERIGNQINIQHINVKAFFRNYNNAGALFLRFVIVKAPYQALAYTIGNIFRAQDATSTAVPYPEFLRPINTLSGVEIVHDSIKCINNDSFTGNSGAVVNKKIKVNKKIQFYNGGTGSLETYGKDYYLVVLAHGPDVGATGTQIGEFNVHAEVLFKDA